MREHHSNSGLLRSGILTQSGKTLMPFATPNTPMDCKRDRTESDIGCFLAGDVRANEQVRRSTNVICLTNVNDWLTSNGRPGGTLAAANAVTARLIQV